MFTIAHNYRSISLILALLLGDYPVKITRENRVVSRCRENRVCGSRNLHSQDQERLF